MHAAASNGHVDVVDRAASLRYVAAVTHLAALHNHHELAYSRQPLFREPSRAKKNN